MLAKFLNFDTMMTTVSWCTISRKTDNLCSTTWLMFSKASFAGICTPAKVLHAPRQETWKRWPRGGMRGWEKCSEMGVERLRGSWVGPRWTAIKKRQTSCFCFFFSPEEQPCTLSYPTNLEQFNNVCVLFPFFFCRSPKNNFQLPAKINVFLFHSQRTPLPPALTL